MGNKFKQQCEKSFRNQTYEIVWRHVWIHSIEQQHQQSVSAKIHAKICFIFFFFLSLLLSQGENSVFNKNRNSNNVKCIEKQDNNITNWIGSCNWFAMFVFRGETPPIATMLEYPLQKSIFTQQQQQHTTTSNSRRSSYSISSYFTTYNDKLDTVASSLALFSFLTSSRMCLNALWNCSFDSKTFSLFVFFFSSRIRIFTVSCDSSLVALDCER